jgi:hypothetical protein
MPKSSTSPTQRSLKWLRDQGYAVAVVEQNKRVPDPKSPGGWKMWKADLWNAFDLIAVHQDKSATLYIQVTSGMGSHRTERQAKIEQSIATKAILAAGNTIHLHIWRKLKPRGVKVPTWKLARFQCKRYEGSLSGWGWFDPDDGQQPVAEEAPLFAAVENDF